jgi:YihY family inner membrane protein
LFVQVREKYYFVEQEVWCDGAGMAAGGRRGVGMREPSPTPGLVFGASIKRREQQRRDASATFRPLNGPGGLGRETRRGWEILCFGFKRFFQIDGAQWAAAFAFNAFFSLFPLMLLIVTMASFFVDRDQAGKAVIAHVESYVPVNAELQHQIFGAITGVIQARRQAGAAAFLLLIWPALQCFMTLICATNLAWGVAAGHWWRLPLKSLLLLGITTAAALLGMAAPVLMRMGERWLFPTHEFHSWMFGLGTFFVPVLVLFFSLSLFYRLAPHHPIKFAEVWAAALCATILLWACESLFVIYLEHSASLNAVYGAFGGVMAFLFWIYLSGCIFIFGACLCAGHAEAHP